jgi:hypothetical protein
VRASRLHLTATRDQISTWQANLASMGNCLDCFKTRPESDPIMDREARMRAAEAAAARAQSAANDPLAKRQAAQVKKEKSFGGPTGKPDLADARTWD